MNITAPNYYRLLEAILDYVGEIAAVVGEPDEVQSLLVDLVAEYDGVAAVVLRAKLEGVEVAG